MTTLRTTDDCFLPLDHSPSREFMIRQACLNAADRSKKSAHTLSRYLSDLTINGTFLPLGLRQRILADYRKIQARYSYDGEVR